MEDSDSKLVVTSVRLPKALHETLRKIAFDSHRSLHSLLLEGARSVADETGGNAADGKIAESHHASAAPRIGLAAEPMNGRG